MRLLLGMAFLAGAMLLSGSVLHLEGFEILWIFICWSWWKLAQLVGRIIIQVLPSNMFHSPFSHHSLTMHHSTIIHHLWIINLKPLRLLQLQPKQVRKYSWHLLLEKQKPISKNGFWAVLITNQKQGPKEKQKRLQQNSSGAKREFVLDVQNCSNSFFSAARNSKMFYPVFFANKTWPMDVKFKLQLLRLGCFRKGVKHPVDHR